ncbi:hypothetical protein VT98_10531 [Candidatus Electrothrix communis]|uniref:Uncharacterized protein n=1 Tax=Candidatus Electrothrix communis TaxID=1859133 RepID=A0A3S3QK17_9BACT|nr:hypothetical protein VT98_10531 [Candidatus Electrothrix communis]
MPINYVKDFKISTTKMQLPELREKRIAKLLQIHTQLTLMYGERYREINGVLKDTREWEKDKNQSELTDADKKKIVDAVSQVRTDTVLFFKTVISRAEFLVNELMPGTFDVDPANQSLDTDDLFDIGSSIAVLGGAIAALGAPPVGGAVAAFGAGMMLGAKVAEELYE